MQKAQRRGSRTWNANRGNIANRPPIPYVAPVDPYYGKREMTKIKVKLPDGTNYQMVPFRVGINEDYVNHIITLMQLIQQKELKSTVEKACEVVLDNRDKLGPLYKKLNMAKFNQEKDDLNKQIKTTKKDLEKTKKVPCRNCEGLQAVSCLLCQRSPHSVGQSCSRNAHEGSLGHSEWDNSQGTPYKDLGFFFGLH